MYVMGASSPVRVSGFVEYAQAEQYFRLLMETAPDALIVIRHEGKIALVNSQTEELFGYNREELLGHTIEMLMPERLRRRHSNHRTATSFIRPGGQWVKARNCMACARTARSFPLKSA